MNTWTTECIHEWIKMNEWMNHKSLKIMAECISNENGWIIKRINESMNDIEWINEWQTDWQTERRTKSQLDMRERQTDSSIYK